MRPHPTPTAATAAASAQAALGAAGFQELRAPAQWRTAEFIADLHLQAGEPATVRAWQQYLAHSQADALFILGDLFEVWVGDDALLEADSFETQACALLAAAARQRPVFFMHGNRDFLAGAAFLSASGMQGLDDPTVLDWHGERYVLSHGDLLCLGDVDYQRFRLLARSAEWQRQFLAQPLASRRAQARGIRAESSARKQSGAVYADADPAASQAWLQSAHARTLIHGHTHRPADHALAPGLQRVVLSDWDALAQPPRLQVLRLSDAGLERADLPPM